jgi:hypothetical protein
MAFDAVEDIHGDATKIGQQVATGCCLIAVEQAEHICTTTRRHSALLGQAIAADRTSSNRLPAAQLLEPQQTVRHKGCVAQHPACTLLGQQYCLLLSFGLKISAH